MKKFKCKIVFYKAMIVEILETLCTICLYLESEGHYGHHNPQSIHMKSHFNTLKGFSKRLKDELAERG